MPAWILFTLLAAFAQNLRSALQRNLAAELTATGAAYVRFVYGLPLAGLYVLVLSQATGTPVPPLNGGFAAAVVLGGAAQVMAAVLLVRMFALRAFTVGTTFSKTETVQTAIIGQIALGERTGPYALAGILVSLAGVMALSMARMAVRPRALLAALVSPVALMGIGCGAGFAVASVAYRAAALSLSDMADPAMAAGLTLLWVLAWQSVLMTAWLAWRDRTSLRASFTRWRAAAPVGLASVIGSIGWFTAFALENAAHVKALGQIELVFALITSHFIFGERTHPVELAGMALVVAGLVLVLL